MDILNVLTSRISVKAYKEDKVDRELLEKIALAGIYAPSGMNRQMTKILVVDDYELVRKIAKLNAGVMGMNNDPFYGAPAVLVVFADKDVNTYKEDGSLVMGNMLNEAHALGLGACWIHRAYESFESEEGQKIKEMYGIPSNYVGIGNCIVGYPKNDNLVQKERKEGRIIFSK